MKHIDVDYALYGSSPLTSEEISFVFSSKFEWHDEEYLVQGIKKYLRTQAHTVTMFNHDFSIEDMLNGRVEGLAAQQDVERIFADWNAQLGHKYFGG